MKRINVRYLFIIVAVSMVPVISGLTIPGIRVIDSASAHCQVPCGIYDDHARVSQMLEDAKTIIKATQKMTNLAGKTDAQSQNQMARWVINKEKHAQNIISTISDYFLTQRVKTTQGDYEQRLKDHHGVIVAAMKAKQNADSSFGFELQTKIRVLDKYYPGHK